MKFVAFESQDGFFYLHFLLREIFVALSGISNNVICYFCNFFWIREIRVGIMHYYLTVTVRSLQPWNKNNDDDRMALWLFRDKLSCVKPLISLTIAGSSWRMKPSVSPSPGGSF